MGSTFFPLRVALFKMMVNIFRPEWCSLKADHRDYSKTRRQTTETTAKPMRHANRETINQPMHVNRSVYAFLRSSCPFTQNDQSFFSLLLHSFYTIQWCCKRRVKVWTVYTGWAGSSLYILDYPCVLNPLTPCHTYPNKGHIGLTSLFYHLFLCLENSGGVLNSIDPNQIWHAAESDLDLHCLPKLVSSNTLCLG